ncbi:MAG TPA: hypothetical protein VHU23_05660 [Rhizomicrobium sp.]|jgi:hypothetical protein|nr:hypothetical protein [Rhizomicrobium sp.]
MNRAKEWERQPPRVDEEILFAVENKREIKEAVEMWNRKLLVGTKLSTGMGGCIAWNPSEKYWCHFAGFDKRGKHKKSSERSYWNPFGLVPERYRKNMIVQINPPDAGKNTNREGVVAKDSRGRIWVLHGGRLSLPNRTLSGEEFHEAAGSHSNPAVVQFRDNTTFRYQKVVMLNQSSSAVQKATAKYVRTSKDVRLYYIDGLSRADVSEQLDEAYGMEGGPAHFWYERKIRNSKAATERKRRDGYVCQICAFKFEDAYGEAGREFAEARHKKWLKNYGAAESADPDKLITVCSNCHRMLHKLGEGSGVEELKNAIQSQQRKAGRRAAATRRSSSTATEFKPSFESSAADLRRQTRRRKQTPSEELLRKARDER